MLRREKGAHSDSTFDTRGIYDLVRILYDFSRLSLIHVRSQRKDIVGLLVLAPMHVKLWEIRPSSKQNEVEIL